MEKYHLEGYATPNGIDSSKKVKKMQAVLGVKQDGIWGPATQAAWDNQRHKSYTIPQNSVISQSVQPRTDSFVEGYTPPAGVTDRHMVRSIQANLGVKQDGVWGSQTQAAWEKQYGGLWRGSSTASKNHHEERNAMPFEIIDSRDDIRQAQQILGVTADGIWGEQTRAAWDKVQVDRHSGTPLVQRKYAQMQNFLEQYNDRISKKERAASFLTPELRKRRYDNDNSGMETMAALYRVFVSDGKMDDARKILIHMGLYNTEAMERKKNNLGEVEYGRQYDATDKLWRDAREAGLSVYEPRPMLANGNVTVEVVKATPMFGLSPDKAFIQEISEQALGVILSNIPYVKWGATLASVAKAFQWKEYFEFNPSAILEKGDVLIYYMPNDIAPEDAGYPGLDYGTTYAFHGNELLYIDPSGGIPEFGQNFMKYAEKYKKTPLNAIAELLFWEAIGDGMGRSAKGMLKKFRRYWS
ncbi:MAG TPA: hypothetical protein PKB13_12370 [Clostridia bacterium]|nr:hypothetical protein [Clostridia bacterium]